MTYPKGSYEHRVLSFLERNKKASMAEMFPVVRIDPTRVKDIVRELVKRGELDEYKPGHFRLGPEAPALDGTGSDGDLEGLLLGALSLKGRATRNVLASAVGQPPASLTQVLRAMSERGLISLDGSAWVLTKKGEAQAPKVKAPLEEPAPSAAPPMRSRRRITPMPAPPTVKAPTAPAPLAARAQVPAAPAAVLTPPRLLPTATPPAPAFAPPPATPSPPRTESPSGRPKVTAWDEGFSFALIPRAAKALVLEELLDLSDLGAEAAAKDGWVELRWDGDQRVLAVVPLTERSRHAVRMEGSRVVSPHPARLLGAGTFRVEWDVGATAFLVSQPV
jgi:DNA-binding MarR family transcriptional regulator